MRPLVLLSGGLDSMTALATVLALPEVDFAGALTMDYGQRNAPEMDKAETLASQWGVETWRKSISFLSGSDPKKEILGRNTLFVAHALEVALVRGFDTIVTGAEPEDIYPDSSVEFIARASALCQTFGVRVIAPLKELSSNQEVLRRALDLGVPLHLVHPSLGPAIDGGCKTSARFLKALHWEFPGIEPEVLLSALGVIHRSRLSSEWCDASFGVGGSTMAVAALFALASERSEGPFIIYTSGAWGKALDLVDQMFFGGRHSLTIVQTSDGSGIGTMSGLSLASPQAAWGLKQAFWRLPRPYRVPGVRLDSAGGWESSQEAEALRSLGYEVGVPRGVTLRTRGDAVQA